ncbi:hypothetical protein HDU77_001618 [Chytriomyces hyalinus]|nr:hypothetical protein HDU77_001618 [Chytriomyces hyalinus]
MATNRFAIVIAATIISLLGILLSLSYSSNTTESNRLITEHFLNSPTLPPLPTTNGTWVNLKSRKEFTDFLTCNLTKSAEKENCCQQHHIDLAHQQKFLIRTGNGDESVAPRSSADFVKLAANKRVFLMGDSMTNQVFEALFSDMDHLGIEVVEMDLRHKFHVDENENGFEVWWRRFYVPMFNATIQTTKTYKYHYHKEEFAMTPSTANLSLTDAENITDPFKMSDLMVTRREHVQWMIDQSDIILFQMGYHYQPEVSMNGIRRTDNVAKLFEPTMHMLFAWFYDIRNQTGKRFIVRDLLPTNNRDLVHEKLCNQKAYRYDQENALLQKLAQQYDFPFVQTEQFYLDKGYAKVGVRKDTKKIDCLHYCMNRFIYAPVINALYEAIYKDLFALPLPGNVTLGNA